MPEEMLKVLPPRARRLWEEVYAASKAKGRSVKRAAREAWSAVKGGWKKGDDGKWVKKMEMLLFAGSETSFQSEEDEGTRIFKKALIEVGEWADPDDDDQRFPVTAERIQGWLENFNARRPALVTVPIGHDGWHDALRNTGYVRDLEFDGQVLWAYIEFTNPDAETLAAEGSIPAVSMALKKNYMDPHDGKNYGEVLYHVALTQSPWIESMVGFQEMATAYGNPIMLSRKTEDPKGKGSGRKVSLKGNKDADTKQKEEDAMAELEAAQERVKELTTKLGETEKKLETEQGSKTELEKELSGLRAEREKTVTEADRQLAKALVAGGIEGAKFGLPGEGSEDAVFALLQSSGSDDSIELAKKEGTVKVSPRKLLGDLLTNVVKSGLVALEDKSKKKDEKPGDGEEGKDFSSRQQKRKGIGEAADKDES